jgi:transposase
MVRFHKPTADQVLVAVRAGASNELAAQHAGIPISVVREWLGRNKQFRKDIEKARADLELLAIGTVRRGLTDKDGEPVASVAQWLAERTHGDAELERLRTLTT